MIQKRSKNDGSSAAPPQFGLSALMWTILVIGIVLAYLRQLDNPRVFLFGALVELIAILVGMSIGWFARRMSDATYWSVIITTAAFLSVAGERAFGPNFVFAWSMVGTLAGACSGAIQPRRLLLRMSIASLAAGITMFAFSAGLPGGAELMFDLILAPLIGGLVAVLVELILWLERNSSIPRYITASWLLCAVVIGNWLVPLAR